ncbi:MAG: 2-oxo acid dehydrogenase subunit E2 [Myxococcota bacterium]|nr:2-oxo acid dehydrogenase subunit E2 [Myxococcota bacterium]
MDTLKKLKLLIQTTAKLPTRRSDGNLVNNLHPYRKLIPFIMPGRNESICYYDDYVKAEPLLDYIQRARHEFGADINVTHLLVAAAAKSLAENPKMNQFVSGSRLYRRNHVAVTFSMKRKKLDNEAKLAAVKLRMDDEAESFHALCCRINRSISIERSDKKTTADKELDFFSLFPRALMRGVASAVGWLDDNNILPKFFMEQDGFYTSMFIANLGSLGMRPAFHHLYEYGNCPLFLMVGQIEDRPVVKGDKVVPEKTLHLRWTYDERIDDGLTSKYGMASYRNALENPDEYFGEIPAIPEETESHVA